MINGSVWAASGTTQNTEVTALEMKNNCFTFTLSVTDFGSAGNDTSASSYKDYNFWNQIKIYLNGQSSPVTLDYANADGDYAVGENPQKGNTFYNLWTTPNTFAVGSSLRINSAAVKVVIPAGTEFPSYQYTSGAVSAKKSFVTTEDITYVKNGSAWEVYVGPSIVNTSVTGMDVANDSFRFTLSVTDFTDGSTLYNDLSASAFTDYNYWTNIKVYMDGETSPVTLEYANADASTNNPQKGNTFYNLFQASNTFAVGSAVGIHQKAVKVVIPAGTEFPSYQYTSGAVSAKRSFVTTEEIIFVKEGGLWIEYIPTIERETVVDALHVRSDSGKLILFLSEHDYAATGGTCDIGDKFQVYNLLQNIVVYKSETEYSTLADIYGDEKYYNIWGENGSVALDLVDGWDGTNVQKVVIKAGCEFPSYEYTSGATNVKTSYKTSYDIIFTAAEQTMNNASYVQSIIVPSKPIETEVESVKIMGSTADIRLIFMLSVQDYEEGLDSVPCLQRFKDYNTMDNVFLNIGNGRIALKDAINEDEVYYNLWGNVGSISYGLKPECTLDSITSVIVESGCEFPAYAYTSTTSTDKVAYTTTVQKELEVIAPVYQVNYFGVDGELLYTDSVACGTLLELRAVPEKAGYIGTWSGLKYTVMPAQNISYQLFYEVVDSAENEETEDTEDTDVEDKIDSVQDEEQQDKKSPTTGDAFKGILYMAIALISLASIAITFVWKKKCCRR